MRIVNPKIQTTRHRMKTKKTRGDENCQSKDIDNKTQNEDLKRGGTEYIQ